MIKLFSQTTKSSAKLIEHSEIRLIQVYNRYYKKTYYLRDAQGNIMATYNRTYAGGSIQDLTMSFSLVERPIYGSSRIANFVDSVQLVYLEAEETEFSYPDDIEIFEQNYGTKHFELTNHASTPLSTGLGNVMAVVSDKRTPVLNATATAIETFQPELLIAKDYYPFGMEMSGRYDENDPEDLSVGYRFGFQNQEKDDEITGQTGSHLNFKYRMYDARIGRFFAVDPLAWKYPYYSTYAFSGNRVIDAVELEGLEPAIPLPVGIGIGVIGTYLIIKYMVENEPPTLEIDKIHFDQILLNIDPEEAYRWQRDQDKNALNEIFKVHQQSLNNAGYNGGGPNLDPDEFKNNPKGFWGAIGGITLISLRGLYECKELIEGSIKANKKEKEMLEQKHENDGVDSPNTFGDYKEKFGEDFPRYMELNIEIDTQERATIILDEEIDKRQ